MTAIGHYLPFIAGSFRAAQPPAAIHDALVNKRTLIAGRGA
jgi:hypothetical protein